MEIDYSRIQHPPHGHPEHSCERYMTALMALVADQIETGFHRDPDELWVATGTPEDLREHFGDPDGFRQWVSAQRREPDCPRAKAMWN